MRDLITAYASAIAFYIVMIFSSLGTALHGQGSEAIASITQPPASFTRKQKKVFLDLVGKETNRAMAIGHASSGVGLGSKAVNLLLSKAHSSTATSLSGSGKSFAR
jgi:hypothetical protein